MLFVCDVIKSFEETEKFVRAASELGINLISTTELKTLKPTDELFFYGTIDRFATFTGIIDYADWSTYSYPTYDTTMYDYLSFISIHDDLPGMCVNGLPLVTTCALAYNHLMGRKDLLEQGSVFVRPNSGWKPFGGQIINTYSLCNAERNLRAQYDELICISPVKQLEKEYRFFTTPYSMVGCQYLPVDCEIPEDEKGELIDFVKRVRKLIGYRCAYVIDIARVGETLKVVEINSYNCSSFYCINPKVIIEQLLEMEAKDV